MTLVGLLPPICDNGNMLVDGGYRTLTLLAKPDPPADPSCLTSGQPSRETLTDLKFSLDGLTIIEYRCLR